MADLLQRGGGDDPGGGGAAAGTGVGAGSSVPQQAGRTSDGASSPRTAAEQQQQQQQQQQQAAGVRNRGRPGKGYRRLLQDSVPVFYRIAPLVDFNIVNCSFLIGAAKLPVMLSASFLSGRCATLSCTARELTSGYHSGCAAWRAA